MTVQEQGDSSLHYINVDHIVQIVHVPNAPVATISMADGKSFRVNETEFRNIVALFSKKHEPAAAHQKYCRAGNLASGKAMLRHQWLATWLRPTMN